MLYLQLKINIYKQRNKLNILQYFFIFFLFLSNPSYIESQESKILFGWKTSTGFLLRDFGDKNIHPQYKGEANNSKPNGLGIMNYPGGKRFLGEWKKGKRDGHGTTTLPNGIRYVGVYKDDKMWNVTKYDSDGKYLGEFKNGYVWNGIVYDKNGSFLGRWINGVKQ